MSDPDAKKTKETAEEKNSRPADAPAPDRPEADLNPLLDDNMVPLPESPDAANDEALDDGVADPRDEQIAALEDALASMKDTAARALADAENSRKRAEKSVADATKYGAAGLAREILSVADNLSRALDAVPAPKSDENEVLTNLRTGVEMTGRELQAALERHKVTRIDPLGQKFDHNLHQAVYEVETEDHPAGHVAQVAQAGYLLHDRLLRPAMVGVAKKPAGNTED